jgi:hypothetical protein
VLVFADAADMDGEVAPARVISSSAFDAIVDVRVDAGDRLFVVESGGSVHSFDGAAALDGAQAPDRTLEIPGAARLAAIAIDSAGTAYVADNALNAVYVYQDIGALNGSVPPDGTVQGLATQLDDPSGVIIVE